MPCEYCDSIWQDRETNLLYHAISRGGNQGLRNSTNHLASIPQPHTEHIHKAQYTPSCLEVLIYVALKQKPERQAKRSRAKSKEARHFSIKAQIDVPVIGWVSGPYHLGQTWYYPLPVNEWDIVCGVAVDERTERFTRQTPVNIYYEWPCVPRPLRYEIKIEEIDVKRIRSRPHRCGSNCVVLLLMLPRDSSSKCTYCFL